MPEESQFDDQRNEDLSQDHATEDENTGGNDADEKSAEERAGELGWKPEGRLTAEEFLEHADVLSPKRTTERLLKEVEELKRDKQKTEKVFKEFRQFQLDRFKTQKEQHERELADLKRQRADAIGNSDGDAVNVIDDRIDALKNSAPVAPKEEEEHDAPKVHPEWEGWSAQNPWLKDPDLAQFAEAQYVLLAKEEIGLPDHDKSFGVALWEKVRARVAKHYPAKMGGNPNRNRPNAISDGSPARETTQDARAWEKLTSQERRMAQSLIDAGAYKEEAKRLKVSEQSLAIKELFS